MTSLTDTSITETPPLRYLRYLPAIYQEMESILPGYLFPFEDRIDTFRDLLSRADNYFTPGMTPAPDFLPWLAGWVALTLDEEWEENQRRRLINHAVELYRWRGTVYGMQRYLELYTGLPLARIEIHESRRPGGMQIGVTSRIGGFSGGPAPAVVETVRRSEPVVERDYYVVSGSTEQYSVYIPTETVTRVEYQDDTVTVWRRNAAEPATYSPATITRRNRLLEDRHLLNLAASQDATVVYHGDSRCVTAVKQPYSFIVRLLLSASEYKNLVKPERLNKVKAIIDLEKPAHTICYLQLDHFRPTPSLHPMQIGVQSSVGLDTYVR